jgi:hypothetical protein
VTTSWDIVADVFPGPQVVERRRVASRRPGSVPSSAVVAVVLAVSTAVGSTEMSSRYVGVASRSSVAISRERVDRGKKSPPPAAAADVADFATARSAEQLARAFSSFFGPASGDGDESEFVFG